MNNFEWSFNTKIIFGKDSESKIGQECISYSKKVMIVRSSSKYIEESGLMPAVRKSLSQYNIEFIELDGIVPNPTIDKVREGINLCRKNHIEMVVAVGGGSVIDTAKAIAVGAVYEGDIWELFIDEEIEIKGALPIGVVSTMAASGSEGGVESVISNPKENTKFEILSEHIRPKFAILNPKFTLTIPSYPTFCGVVDILAHAMERYFTNTENVELTDRMGEGLMKTVVNNGKKLSKDLKDYNARSEIMWASTLAHNGLLDTGRESCWASHMIGTAISAHYDSAHGATLSVILPAWMKYIYKSDLKRFAQFASNVFDVEYNEDNLEEVAWLGIEELVKFFKILHMPTTIEELGIMDKSNYSNIAKQATRFGDIGCIKSLNEGDVVNILELAI